MTKNEIDSLLNEIFPTESEPLAAPTTTDWEEIKTFFSTEFPEDFVFFMELIGNYCIKGELLRISEKNNISGIDTIVSAVLAERTVGNWPENLIPFFSVGNGDYYCLTKGLAARVVYIYHEDRSMELLHDSFELFLKNELADFA
jgi:hypothetical protein